MIGRRKFFGVLGSAPLAAKAAADAAMADSINIAANGLSQARAFDVSSSIGPPLDVANGAPNKIAEFIRQFGIPEHERERMWEACRWVGSLDPDIAAKRSWSMSVKILTQRQRNFERQINHPMKRWGFEQARAALAEKLGWHFWI